jgi:radical SAM superfamily enzyme YgiQ (UPF0313 family)
MLGGQEKMPQLRVALVHAVDQRIADTQMFGIHFMPVWAYTLAAHLEDLAGVDVVLHDLRLETLPAELAADVYLFTGINQDCDAILATAAEVRRRAPRARLVIGGPICWSYEMAGRLGNLDVFDHVFIGDGEETLPAFLRSLQAGDPGPRIVRALHRFDLSQARPMNDRLLRATAARYYGGVLEVSRGCPFLCEFCDIRVQPDNNRTHVKHVELIVRELDRFWELGIRQTLFACDHFAGDPRWAEAVCDRIIEWKTATGRSMSLYTWLTIDLYNHPRLLQRLRAAGFDMFFIGVESFNRASLMETAKIQNTTLDLVQALRTIQSYGFIVVAGLIMGFDTDTEDIVDVTLKGILESGLISGDPSLLTALPGTPLYRRMQLSGRLRDAKLGLGGFKYQTNIRYLRTEASIRNDFKRFVRDFNRGAYQYARLRAFLTILEASATYAPPASTTGYANLGRLLAMTLRKPLYLLLLLGRVARLVGHPVRLAYILRAAVLVARRSAPSRPLWFYFKFWLFNWSNSLVKYSGLSARDFDIESVPADFDMKNLLPEAYETPVAAESASSKVHAQRKLTAQSLKVLMASRPEA